MLVVETTGLRDGGWLDINGTPLSDRAKLERFRRVSYGRLEIDITVDDEKFYTRPWTVRVNQRIMPDQELIEFICLENQRFAPQTFRPRRYRCAGLSTPKPPTSNSQEFRFGSWELGVSYDFSTLM